jgi:hypothetical protein
LLRAQRQTAARQRLERRRLFRLRRSLCTSVLLALPAEERDRSALQQLLQRKPCLIARARFVCELARKAVKPFAERQLFRLQDNPANRGRPTRLDESVVRHEQKALAAKVTLEALDALLLAEEAC